MREKTDIKNRLPIIRKSVVRTEPPAEGEGIRLAVYQGQGRVGNHAAIAYNLANLEKWAALCAGHGAQLLVTPELFLCGYNIYPEDIPNVALTADEAAGMVAPIAKKNNLAIVCPYAEKESVAGAPYYDSMVLVDRDGRLLRNYRKTHLWGNGEKANWWFGYVNDPQNAYQVKPVNGINVGMLNCYEAEFPELTRILALNGAQLIVIPTAADVGTLEANGNWSDWAYPDVSRTAIPASAYQNKIFVTYSNHALFEHRSDGTTLTGVYLGNSVIADPYGQLMVHAENVETLLIADCIPADYMPTHPEGESDYIKDRRPPLYQAFTSMQANLPGGDEFEYPHDPNKKWHP
jgi:predicted amidohydrolase